MGKVAAAPWRFPEPDGRRKIVLAGLDAVVADDRNGVPLCTAHHDSFDTRNGQSLHLPAPECVREFAAEYGLEHLIEEEL
jgi:nitrite reductase/ring-hydroxylating ferredoxin subunit